MRATATASYIRLAKANAAVRSLVLAALMGALLVAGKQMMSGLPNIEPVSFLIVLYTLEFPRETPGAISVYLVLEGVLYGFGLWWAMYLYVWFILMGAAWLCRYMDKAWFWALVSGAYGLCFGGLCAVFFLFARDPAFALAWWISGLPFDLVHAGGNFVIMLLLYRPVRRALQLAKKQMPIVQ
jgi:energy-coupling factor transport system substrate-specific component